MPAPKGNQYAIETVLPDAGHVVRSLMAAGAAENVRAYLSRGRRFADTPEHELAELLRQGLKTWAADPQEPAAMRLSDDVMAEYHLRGRRDFFDAECRGYMDQLAERMAEMMLAMSAEDYADMEAELKADYRALMRGRS